MKFLMLVIFSLSVFSCGSDSSSGDGQGADAFRAGATGQVCYNSGDENISLGSLSADTTITAHKNLLSSGSNEMNDTGCRYYTKTCNWIAVDNFALSNVPAGLQFKLVGRNKPIEFKSESSTSREYYELFFEAQNGMQLGVSCYNVWTSTPDATMASDVNCKKLPEGYYVTSSLKDMKAILSPVFVINAN